jgi:uncharacterized protein
MTVTKNRLHEIYDDFARARLDKVEQIFDQNVDFISHAPIDVFPYLGRRRGRAAVLKALSDLHQQIEVLSFLPVTTLIDGEAAALTVFVHVRDRSSGRLANFLAAHFLRFRDDKIVEYRAIVDSLDLVQQMLAERFQGSPIAI